MFCNRVSSLMKNISASDLEGGRSTEAIRTVFDFGMFISNHRISRSLQQSSGLSVNARLVVCCHTAALTKPSVFPDQNNYSLSPQVQHHQLFRLTTFCSVNERQGSCSQERSLFRQMKSEFLLAMFKCAIDSPRVLGFGKTKGSFPTHVVLSESFIGPGFNDTSPANTMRFEIRNSFEMFRSITAFEIFVDLRSLFVRDR